MTTLHRFLKTEISSRLNRKMAYVHLDASPTRSAFLESHLMFGCRFRQGTPPITRSVTHGKVILKAETTNLSTDTDVHISQRAIAIIDQAESSRRSDVNFKMGGGVEKLLSRIRKYRKERRLSPGKNPVSRKVAEETTSKSLPAVLSLVQD